MKTGKSILILFSATCILFTLASNAQTTILFEDFASGSLPTGWTISKDTPSIGWQFGNNTQAIETTQGDTLFAPPAHGNFAFDLEWNDDLNGTSNSNKADLDRLITPPLNFSSYNGVFVKFVAYFLGYGYTDTTYTEKLTFEASLDRGKTWSTVGEVYGNNGTWQNLNFNASAYAGDTGVEFCFHYNDADTILVGAAVDSLLVYEPLQYDASVFTQNVVLNPIENYVTETLKYANYIQKNSSNAVSGELINYGSQTITSMNLDWSINGGKINTTSLTSLNIAPFAYYNYTSSIPIVSSVDGNDTLKIWVDSINGSNPDQNPSIDTLSTDFVVIDTVEKKMVMLEDFGQASCDPCAIYMANLDSVYQNSKNFCNIIRYHVDWPGQDFMNDETQSQVVVRQQDLYDITGVPHAVIDGEIGLSTGALFSPLIYAESYPGTPMKIAGTYNYDVSTHTHTVSATVKSFANFPAGLNLYAVIIDSLAYTKNQSTESIPQYYFPEVVEEMLPTANGDALGKFKDDTSQSVTYTWNQTHPLGADFSSFPYDSGNYAVVIFVQDPTTKVVYQSLAIPATVTDGIDELNSGLTKVNAYPNPFNNTINLTMNLQKNENVIVKLSDILGREILVSDEGSLNSGEHTFMYDASSLALGIYLLEIQTDNGSLSLKVIKSN